MPLTSVRIKTSKSSLSLTPFLSRYVLSNWHFLFFTSRTFQEALIIPISFPDIIRALTPTVTVALVDAASTFWQVKKPTLTHDAFAINKYVQRLDFSLLIAFRLFQSTHLWNDWVIRICEKGSLLSILVLTTFDIEEYGRTWKCHSFHFRLNLSDTAIYQDKPIAFIAVVHIHMRARYYRVSRLVVLPDYQGIGVGKWLLNFIAELYTSQTKIPFYVLTSNPQIIRGNMENWKITRFGHASKGKGNTRINNEIRNSLSRKRITVSMQYVPAKVSHP